MLIDLLDGTRDQATLTELLASAISQGQLTVTENQQQVQNYDDAKRVLGIALPETLTRLANSALLIA